MTPPGDLDTGSIAAASGSSPAVPVCALQIETLRYERTTADDVRRALGEFDGVWNALSPREQNELLRSLLERIEFDGASEEVTLTFHAGWRGENREQVNELVEEAA